VSWGYHALFDCQSCPIERVTSEENIREFINEIVSAIDMTGHFSDKTGDCYIDVFSCKEYDTDVAADVIDDFFRPEEVKMRYFERGDLRFTKKG
jgi:S-adenosylmethionine/arginine decarboxylase-like enzyme